MKGEKYSGYLGLVLAPHRIAADMKLAAALDHL